MTTPPPLPGDPFVSAGGLTGETVPYQMAPVTDDAAAQPRPQECVNCGSVNFSAQTKLPVCEPCRMELVKRPFPLWVRLSTCAVFLMMIVSLALSGERIREAFLLARAKKMREQQQWEEAYQAYRQLTRRHIDTENLLTYAEMAANSGHYEEAASTLQTLGGRSALRDQVARADAVAQTVLRAMPKAPAPQPSFFQPSQPSFPRPSATGSLSGFQLDTPPLIRPAP